MEHFGRRGRMDIVAKVEVVHHGRVLTQMGDDTQLDLAIVGGKEGVGLAAWHEGTTDLAAFLGTHGDVLQVGVVGTQSPRSRHRLVV